MGRVWLNHEHLGQIVSKYGQDEYVNGNKSVTLLFVYQLKYVSLLLARVQEGKLRRLYDP